MQQKHLQISVVSVLKRKRTIFCKVCNEKQGIKIWSIKIGLEKQFHSK